MTVANIWVARRRENGRRRFVSLLLFGELLLVRSQLVRLLLSECSILKRFERFWAKICLENTHILLELVDFSAQRRLEARLHCKTADDEHADERSEGARCKRDFFAKLCRHARNGGGRDDDERRGRDDGEQRDAAAKRADGVSKRHVWQMIIGSFRRALNSRRF